jgi:hypothetical protein
VLMQNIFIDDRTGIVNTCTKKSYICFARDGFKKIKKATIINDFAPNWESLGGHMAKKKAKKATKKAAKKATKKKATKKH